MSDIIHLLPDSIANQIAAGEVIQRPASVVKELVENAVDAGATRIQVNIKDAGRTLIQVIDNGKGMSETDARMAFERHATSKITTADDLFALHTMGFRGEALASIVAVSQVELRTRLRGAALGTRLLMAGSVFEKIETDACAEGSIFSVKNLFFNVPARRKFLKANDTEFRNIVNEFERIALVNAHISLALYHNDMELFNLPESGLRRRIANVYGKAVNAKLLSLDARSALATVSGFIGTPDSAKKRGALQYFFVNGRFMKHPYFHKAVVYAYDHLVPVGDTPDYFIYFTLDPAAIDVNIHPVKTEIKFENEQSVWQIIVAAIRESLAKSNAIPTIDFDTKDAIDIPVYNPSPEMKPAQAPQIDVNTGYNPFVDEPSGETKKFDWMKFYKRFDEDRTSVQTEAGQARELQREMWFGESAGACYQYKGQYIVTAMKSGLALIDQRRAHIRILYDQYVSNIRQRRGVSQQLLFPEIVTFTTAEAAMLPALSEELHYIGFDLNNLGNNTWSITGIPAGMENLNPPALLKDTVNHAIETGIKAHEEIAEAIALSLAKAAAIRPNKKLSVEEMDHLIASLFSSSSATYTPDGKCILSILPDDELEKRFN
jgi:DNA mismatch repair protein MutL